MNIRHKTTGEEFELIDNCGRERTVYDANGERRLFKKDVLEEITPEPQWVDVTAECDVKYHGDLMWFCHKEVAIMEFVKTYRLRKISYANCEQHGTSGYQCRDAFVVEKRQP